MRAGSHHCDALSVPFLERAGSSTTRLGEQFDAVIYLDHTSAGRAARAAFALGPGSHLPDRRVPPLWMGAFIRSREPRLAVAPTWVRPIRAFAYA